MQEVAARLAAGRSRIAAGDRDRRRGRKRSATRSNAGNASSPSGGPARSAARRGRTPADSACGRDRAGRSDRGGCVPRWPKPRRRSERCRAAAEAAQSEAAVRQQREAAAVDDRAPGGGRARAARGGGERARSSRGAGGGGESPGRRSCRRCASPQGSRRRSARCSRTSCRRSVTTHAAMPARFWVELPALAECRALPAGAHPLAAAVTAPPALGRSLACAGWVASEADGRSLQPLLAPGQRLVDRDGRLWRWDGFTRLTPGASARGPAAAPPQPARHSCRRDRGGGGALRSADCRRSGGNRRRAKPPPMATGSRARNCAMPRRRWRAPGRRSRAGRPRAGGRGAARRRRRNRRQARRRSR